MYLRSTPIPLLAQHPLRLRIQVNLIITQPCLVSSSTVHIHANSVWRYHPANPAPTAPHTHPNPIVCSKQNDPEHIWFHGCRKDLRSHCQMRCTMDRYEDHRGIIFCSAMFCVFRSAVTLHVSDEKSIALSTVIFKAFKGASLFCVMCHAIVPAKGLRCVHFPTMQTVGNRCRQLPRVAVDGRFKTG